jgi:hypothetical protein
MRRFFKLISGLFIIIAAECHRIPLKKGIIPALHADRTIGVDCNLALLANATAGLNLALAMRRHGPGG